MNIKLEDINILGVPLDTEDRDVNWVFNYNEEMYRLVINSDVQNKRWSQSQEFAKSLIFQKLMEKKLVPKYELTEHKLEQYENGDIYRIKDFVYCLPNHCRTLSQKLDCIKLVCKIFQLLEEEQSEFILADPHTNQIGFNYWEPQYIDIGSFSPINRENAKENAVNHFSEHMLKEFGLTYKRNWNELIADSEKVELSIPKFFWSDYGDGVDQREKDIVLPWIESKEEEIKTIVDVGSNAGGFAKLFASLRYGVVAIEEDEYSLNKLYKNSNGKNIFCAKINVLENLLNDWWSSWENLIKSDLVFCSSITHHLYKAGMNFKQQANLWSKLGTKFAIIEMIDKTDIHVKQWDLDNEYTQHQFLLALKADWELLKIKASPTQGRCWYFFRKRDLTNG